MDIIEAHLVPIASEYDKLVVLVDIHAVAVSCAGLFAHFDLAVIYDRLEELRHGGFAEISDSPGLDLDVRAGVADSFQAVLHGLRDRGLVFDVLHHLLQGQVVELAQNVVLLLEVLLSLLVFQVFGRGGGRRGRVQAQLFVDVLLLPPLRRVLR